MTQTKKFLEEAYELENAQQTHDMYSNWAASYDKEISDNGYASPRRTAQALAIIGVPKETLILDIGCGTGVSGEALLEEGFVNLHGSDFSADMLSQADKKNIYSELFLADLSTPYDFVDKPYPILTAVGVFSIGHATAKDLLSMIDMMPLNGLLAFSLNDHALEDESYMDCINRSIFSKKIRLRWHEYGDHLPGVNLQSSIVVLEKTN